MTFTLFLFKLLQAFHLLRFQEFIDAAKMLFHFLVAEFIHLTHQPVKEITVMGYHDKRTVKVKLSLYQDIFCHHDEVIGRLIENQQIDRFKK